MFLAFFVSDFPRCTSALVSVANEFERKEWNATSYFGALLDIASVDVDVDEAPPLP